MLPHQSQAIPFVEATARDVSPCQAWHGHRASVTTGFDAEEYERLADRIANGSSIDVHFHPDRIIGNGQTVIEALATSRIYQNQFVTGVCNGALDTGMSGKRRRRESRIFGAAYDGHPDADRPTYGALNLFDTQDGACPRFGRCYLTLRPETLSRCTLSYGDSHVEPAARGSARAPGPLLNALARDFANATDHVEVEVCIARQSRKLHEIHGSASQVAIHQGRILDDIIEVQLHGELSLRSDVRQLSAVAAFQDTRTGVQLTELSKACRIELTWRREAVVCYSSPAPFAKYPIF